MVILDTNVISELMGGPRRASLAVWLLRFATDDLFTTAVTEAEILAGIGRLPAGRRRDDLAARAASAFEQDFDGKVLPFDRNAARHYAEIVAHRTKLGRPVGTVDCMIAAIARHHDAAIATRNIHDFTDIGLNILNPWSEP